MGSDAPRLTLDKIRAAGAVAREFDDQPIRLPGFVFTTKAVQAVGLPRIQEWTAALHFALSVEESSPFWVGALYNYGEGRKDWADKLEQALADMGRPVTHKTLINLGYIDRNLDPRAKALAPSVALAAEVVALPAAEQVAWMQRAADEHLTKRELRLELKAAKRPAIIEGQSRLAGQYRVFSADFPWSYSDRPPSGSGAVEHYPGMTVDEGIALPVRNFAAKDAVLFFWVTAPMLCYATDPAQGPDWYRIIRAWGFEPKTGLVWDKVEHVFGHYVSVRHEHLIIATRGSCTPDRPNPQPDSVVVERRRDGAEHSEKPEAFRLLIERLYDGPYCELFARRPAPGWAAFGNDARLWAPATEARAFDGSAVLG